MAQDCDDNNQREQVQKLLQMRCEHSKKLPAQDTCIKFLVDVLKHWLLRQDNGDLEDKKQNTNKSCDLSVGRLMDQLKSKYGCNDDCLKQFTNILNSIIGTQIEYSGECRILKLDKQSLHYTAGLHQIRVIREALKYGAIYYVESGKSHRSVEQTHESKYNDTRSFNVGDVVLLHWPKFPRKSPYIARILKVNETSDNSKQKYTIRFFYFWDQVVTIASAANKKLEEFKETPRDWDVYEGAIGSSEATVSVTSIKMAVQLVYGDHIKEQKNLTTPNVFQNSYYFDPDNCTFHKKCFYKTAK